MTLLLTFIIVINRNNLILLIIFITKSRLYGAWVRDQVLHLGLNVSSSAHNCGCVVDGSGAMAAI